MRSILILLVISAGVFSEYSYKPLTSKEQKLFKKTYADLMVAYKANDFVIFEQFATVAVDQFRNILLDRGSVSIKPKYCEIDSLLKVVKSDKAAAESKVVLSSICSADQKVTMYKKRNNSDSVLYYQKRLLYISDSSMCPPSLDVYRDIMRCENITEDYKQKTSDKVKALFQERFLELSANAEYDSLDAFSKMYPDIFTEDIVQLKEKAAQKMRLSILRKPSFAKLDEYTFRFGEDAKLVQAVKASCRKYLLSKFDAPIFEEYYKRFPEDDFKLFESIENNIYNKSLLSRSLEDINLYLKYFPNGRYAQIVISLQRQVCAVDTTTISQLQRGFE
jgi:hypothetical protein